MFPVDHSRKHIFFFLLYHNNILFFLYKLKKCGLVNFYKSLLILYTQIFKLRHVFFNFLNRILNCYSYFLYVSCVTRKTSITVSLSRDHISIIHLSTHLSSIYLFQKRRRETHTERREGHQNVLYIPNYYMLYWFLRAIVNYRSNLSFQSEYPVWRHGFYQCGTILVNVAFSLKILIIAIIIFSESQKDTKLYMDVLSACVPRIVRCSIIIFENGNREVTRLKLVSKPYGVYIQRDFRCYKLFRISSFLPVQKHIRFTFT